MKYVRVCNVFQNRKQLKRFITSMEEENKLTINALYKLSNNELMSRFPPFTKIYKYEPFTVSCKIVNPGKGHDYQVLVSADNENWYLVGNFHKGDRDLSALRKTKSPNLHCVGDESLIY